MTRAPSGGRAIPQSQLAAPTAGGDRTGDSATYPPMGNGPRSGRREPTRRRRAHADARRQTHDDQRDAGHAGPVPNPAAAYSRTSGGDRPSNGRDGHWQSALRVVQLSRRERRDHPGAEPCDHDLARWGRGQLECSRPAGPQVRSGAPALVGTEAQALLPGPMRIRKLHDRLAGPGRSALPRCHSAPTPARRWPGRGGPERCFGRGTRQGLPHRGRPYGLRPHSRSLAVGGAGEPQHFWFRVPCVFPSPARSSSRKGRSSTWRPESVGWSSRSGVSHLSSSALCRCRTHCLADPASPPVLRLGLDGMPQLRSAELYGPVNLVVGLPTEIPEAPLCASDG